MPPPTPPKGSFDRAPKIQPGPTAQALDVSRMEFEKLKLNMASLEACRRGPEKSSVALYPVQ